MVDVKLKFFNAENKTFQEFGKPFYKLSSVPLIGEKIFIEGSGIRKLFKIYDIHHVINDLEDSKCPESYVYLYLIELNLNEYINSKFPDIL
jgi:hypothetical protein